MTIYSFDLKSRRIGTLDYPAPVSPPEPSPRPAFWDEDTAINFVVTEGGLLASESVSVDAEVYSRDVFQTGKRYVEIEIVSGTANLDVVLGVAAEGETWVAGGMGIRDWSGVGAGNAGVNEFRKGTNPSVSGATTGVLVQFVGASRIGIAFDSGARQMWIRGASGYATGADPATGAQPTFSGWQAGLNWRLFARADNDGASHSLRLHAGTNSTYLYGPPSGFTAGIRST